MQRDAAFSAAQVRRLSAMVESAPSVPLLVRSDMRIEGSDRLARWMGFAALPSSFDGLTEGDIGISAHDFDALRTNIIAAQRTARPFEAFLTIAASGKTLLVRGVPADLAVAAPGSVVLWLSDLSDFHADLQNTRQERSEAVAAFEALSALIEAAPMPMWFRRNDDRLMLVNAAYAAATGAEDANDAIARQIELIEPVAGEAAIDAAHRALSTGQMVQRTIPVTAYDIRRLTRVVDVPVGNSGTAGYAIDLHDLDQARAEARQLAQSQRDMLDRLSSGVARFANDRSIIFTNQPFRRMFGLDLDWLSEFPDFDRVLDRMRDGGRVPETRDYPEWRNERANWFAATDMIEEAWLLRDNSHIRTIAQPTPDGGLLLLFEDRTEQIRLASARDTLLRVRTATLDNLFEGISVFSSDGRLQNWNKRFREIWGMDDVWLTTHPRLDALLSRVAPQLKKPQHATILQEMVRSATAERRQRSGRADFANGECYHVAATPLPDGNALFSMMNITDSKRIEHALRERNDALEDADRIKSDFLAKMSYELRTPITSISGFAEMLQGGYAGEIPPPAKEYVAAILQSAADLGRHIDTVLDLAQSEAGTLPLEKTKLDIRQLLQEACDAALASAQQKNIELVIEINPSLGHAEGDARRIRQIIDQLLENALNYTAAARTKEGRILLHGDGTEDKVRIIISDNGPGLSEAAQAIAFDIKARSPSADSAATGFGLALARQLAEAHSGSLSLVSRLGEGTMVVLEWPRQ
jgi:signal transduction histidine kinase